MGATRNRTNLAPATQETVVNNNEAPVAQEAANNEAPVVELEKVVGDDVIAAVLAASGNLKGESYDSLDAAKAAAGEEDDFFNPTLSQYREGLCINTDRTLCKIKRVSLPNSSRKAWVITCPAGYKKDGKIVYSQAFNMYPSTLRKVIQRTDDLGNPVLGEDMQPITTEALTASNQVWAAAHACSGSDELLEFAMDKVYETIQIIRDFGPSVFVKQLDGSRKATSHKLTSVPLFNVIG